MVFDPGISDRVYTEQVRQKEIGKRVEPFWLKEVARAHGASAGVLREIEKGFGDRYSVKGAIAKAIVAVLGDNPKHGIAEVRLQLAKELVGNMEGVRTKNEKNKALMFSGSVERGNADTLGLYRSQLERVFDSIDELDLSAKQERNLNSLRLRASNVHL